MIRKWFLLPELVYRELQGEGQHPVASLSAA